jgi:hypothetical protein
MHWFVEICHCRKHALALHLRLQQHHHHQRPANL